MPKAVREFATEEAEAQGADDVLIADDPEAEDEQQDDGAASQGEATDTGSDESGEGEEGEQGAGEGADEVVVTIGDESPSSEQGEQEEAVWVNDLRKRNREQVRRIRELERQLKSAEPQGQPAAVQVGEKPTLEGCDFDSADYESKLDAWHERKRAADEQQRSRDQANQQAQADWQAKLDAYGTAKAALKVSDYEDAEAAAQDALTVVQQGVILNGAESPALLVYALGKNPAKLKTLAAIADPVKFAFAVAKLETQLKVTPRKSAPAPERALRSSAVGVSSVDSVLERLRAEAEKTGNMTKVVAYKAQQKAKQRA